MKLQLPLTMPTQLFFFYTSPVYPEEYMYHKKKRNSIHFWKIVSEKSKTGTGNNSIKRRWSFSSILSIPWPWPIRPSWQYKLNLHNLHTFIQKGIALLDRYLTVPAFGPFVCVTWLSRLLCVCAGPNPGCFYLQVPSIFAGREKRDKAEAGRHFE